MKSAIVFGMIAFMLLDASFNLRAVSAFNGVSAVDQWLLLLEDWLNPAALVIMSCVLVAAVIAPLSLQASRVITAAGGAFFGGLLILLPYMFVLVHISHNDNATALIGFSLSVFIAGGLAGFTLVQWMVQWIRPSFLSATGTQQSVISAKGYSVSGSSQKSPG